MATIKSYTSLEQSKKLTDILSLDSADMSWVCNGLGKPFARTIPIKRYPEELCGCWSLAALISVLPNDTSLLYFDDAYQMVYDKKPYVISNKFDNPVDACVAMVEKLHELNLL